MAIKYLLWRVYVIFTQIPIFTALFQSDWKIKDMKKSSSSLRRMGQRFISNKKSKFALNAKHFCVTKHIIKLTAVACTVLSDKSVPNPNHDLIFYLYFYLYSFDITNFMAKLISLAFLLNNVEPLTDANTNIFQLHDKEFFVLICV